MSALQTHVNQSTATFFSIAGCKLPALIIDVSSAFSNLLQEMNRLHITAILDSMYRVSRSYVHRTLLHLTVGTMSTEGVPIRHLGLNRAKISGKTLFC